MKPYYEDDLVTLYHGDCVELADAWVSADVLITDPPYGMAYQSSMAKAGPSALIAGDDTTELRDRVLELWQADNADRPALVFGTWRVPRPDDTRQLIVWDKGDSPGMGDLTLPWGPAHEDIYVIGHGWDGKRRPNVYRCPTIPPGSADRPDHPTPKPIPLDERDRLRAARSHRRPVHRLRHHPARREEPRPPSGRHRARGTLLRCRC